MCLTVNILLSIIDNKLFHSWYNVSVYFKATLYNLIGQSVAVIQYWYNFITSLQSIKFITVMMWNDKVYILVELDRVSTDKMLLNITF